MNRKVTFRGVIIILVSGLIGWYYLWQVHAATGRFRWGPELDGYYDYLARAFLHGRAYLPIVPRPELLALPNPWDTDVGNAYKLHDAVLYKGRYYLYHGAGPAVMLFAPWRLLARRDLPENFGLFLLCFGGYLFSCGALLRLLALANARPGAFVSACLLLGLGICQSIPYLLNRVLMYEIAVGGGYFCVSAALFFLIQWMATGQRTVWLAGSGLMFGLAVSCRPHLVLAGAVFLAGLALYLKRSRWREFMVFAAPMMLIGVAIAAYNYVRFGSPFEFGLRYLLAWLPDLNRVKLALPNVLPGLYFNLLCPPDFSYVFPWVRLVWRRPFDSPTYPSPPGYYLEAIAGALWLAPFIVPALLVCTWPRAALQIRLLIWSALAASIAILLFVTATGFTTQRYEADFLPLMVFAAMAGTGIYLGSSAGLKRTAVGAVLAASIAYSAVVNLALGIQGPYNDMVKNRPAAYFRIANWFSPVEEFRPLLNPKLSVDLTAKFDPQPDLAREPLVVIGTLPYRHFIFAEHRSGKLRVVSQSATSTVAQEIPDPGSNPAGFKVTYIPESGTLTTSVNGVEVLAHAIGLLVTAPSEIAIGRNRLDPDVTLPNFTGRIYHVRWEIGPRNR